MATTQTTRWAKRLLHSAGRMKAGIGRLGAQKMLYGFYAGVVLLAGGFLAGWTVYNWYTLCCLLLILATLVAYVVCLKQESKY